MEPIGLLPTALSTHGRKKFKVRAQKKACTRRISLSTKRRGGRRVINIRCGTTFGVSESGDTCPRYAFLHRMTSSAPFGCAKKKQRPKIDNTDEAPHTTEPWHTCHTISAAAVAIGSGRGNMFAGGRRGPFIFQVPLVSLQNSL